MPSFVKFLAIGVGIALFIFLFVLQRSPEVRIRDEAQGKVYIPEVIPIRPATTSGIRGGASQPQLPASKKVTAPPLLPASKIVIPLKLSPVVKSEAATTTVVEKPLPPSGPALPPLDVEEIMSAVVKIQCPAEDGLGKYIGSGFVLNSRTVVTAAHVVKDAGSEVCDVIFQKDRRPIHYLRGTLENLQTIIKRHDEEGIDVAVLTLPPLDEYPEARAIFSEYPKILYPVCASPQMLGDKLLHFGYPSNYVDQNYLSRLEGEAVVHADIKGIKEQLSEDQTFVFKTPILGFTYDESGMHPYMVSRVASFYGDSGGLAFNQTKQCVIGPHRGGTIGKSAGENFSVFMNLGWVKNQLLDFGRAF